MRCHKVKRLLPDYLAGELRSKDKEKILHHLDVCADCRGELVCLQEVWRGLEQQQLPAPGEEFWLALTARVMAGLSHCAPWRGARPQLVWYWRILVPALGFALLILTAVALKGIILPSDGRFAQEEEVSEIAFSFSLAPIAEAQYPYDRLASAGLALGLTEDEVDTCEEVLAHLFADQGLYAALAELEEGELSRLNRLLSSQFSKVKG